MELDDRCQCCSAILPDDYMRYRCQECYEAGECNKSGAMGKCHAHCQYCKEESN